MVDITASFPNPWSESIRVGRRKLCAYGASPMTAHGIRKVQKSATFGSQRNAKSAFYGKHPVSRKRTLALRTVNKARKAAIGRCRKASSGNCKIRKPASDALRSHKFRMPEALSDTNANRKARKASSSACMLFRKPAVRLLVVLLMMLLAMMSDVAEGQCRRPERSPTPRSSSSTTTTTIAPSPKRHPASAPRNNFLHLAPKVVVRKRRATVPPLRRHKRTGFPVPIPPVVPLVPPAGNPLGIFWKNCEVGPFPNYGNNFLEVWTQH